MLQSCYRSLQAKVWGWLAVSGLADEPQRMGRSPPCPCLGQPQNQTISHPPPDTAVICLRGTAAKDLGFSAAGWLGWASTWHIGLLAFQARLWLWNLVSMCKENTMAGSGSEADTCIGKRDMIQVLVSAGGHRVVLEGEGCWFSWVLEGICYSFVLSCWLSRSSSSEPLGPKSLTALTSEP